MHYQIQTMPIWDAFKGDGCPLCALYSLREQRVVKQYLEENVMDPEFRTQSNKVGFCDRHIKKMYAGQNKLGLALQLETRAAYLRTIISAPADKKSAKKQAQKISSHCGCVICSALDDPMRRYYLTVAEMYLHESEFPALLKKSTICLKHTASLMEYAEYAGKQIKPYLADLTDNLSRALSLTEKNLREFADCFDFRNAGVKPNPAVIPDAIKLLITNEI